MTTLNQELMNKIEKLVKEETRNVETVVHNFMHMKRTAIGAVWFIKFLNGTEEEEKLAYIAGLLHDIIRPATEQICHAKASADRSREILKQFELNPNSIEKIVQAIKDHRKPVEWGSPLHQSVYLSDKLLEQLGAYIIFRRSMYIGECKDYNETAFNKAIIYHFKLKMKKVTSDKFSGMFSKLFYYQNHWILNFFNAFLSKEDWAWNMAKFGYTNGRNHTMTLEEMIQNYGQKHEKDKEARAEALKYINGEKIKEFEKLISNEFNTY